MKFLNTIKNNIILFFFFSGSLLAQENNVFSQYGLGQVQTANFALLKSMAGISSAFNSKYNINYYNPASYSKLEYTSFETALQINSSKISDNINTEKYSDPSLPYLALGFPIAKWWGSSFGVIPYTKSNYNIIYSEKNTAWDTITYQNIAIGGINRFYWGNGFNIGKNFSVGLNINYLFGRTREFEYILFNDTSVFNTPFNTRVTSSTDFSTLQFNYGLQYEGTLKNDVQIILGAYMQPEKRFTSSRNILLESFKNTSSIKDTVGPFTEIGITSLPIEYSLGFSISKNDNWSFGAQWRINDWTNFEHFGKTDTLGKGSIISIGWHFKPSHDVTNKKDFLKKWNYRMGFLYGINNLVINNQPMKEIGMTFGIGIPLRGNAALLNLSFELGKTGNIKQNLIEQNYFKTTAGITLSEKWFVRRKIE